jgi:hypothetical protein
MVTNYLISFSVKKLDLPEVVLLYNNTGQFEEVSEDLWKNELEKWYTSINNSISEGYALFLLLMNNMSFTALHVSSRRNTAL